MRSIDDKVVAMSFENRRFESGVKTSMGSIEKLKRSLEFTNAARGLESISSAANRVTLGHIASGVDTISGKFTALSVTALAVFASIGLKVVSVGAQVTKALTIQPIVAGFQEYATNLNSIQTILANTQASGANLDDVNAALLNLNKYSDKTIYNFGQMARNIGTFTAAGVDLDTSVGAIKGIANLAALSGSSADQASTAMYQLSQAIAAGRVGLQDWNSVVNAGMGGTVFQRALATTAQSMGTLKGKTLELVGPMKNVKINGRSFRDSITAKPGETSWLTSDVLTKTLQQFTGDLSNAQLKAQGFNDAQIKSIQQTAKTAQHAATEVKTISQVFDVAKETAGSGWAQTFQIIFGNFNEAKKTFTDLSNTINGFINANSAARNKVLADWKKLGGRTLLIAGIQTAFHNLLLILEPIRKAFREIFPAKTGRDLFIFTAQFKNFADALKPSPKTVANLHRTFKGLFALLDIGKQIVVGVFHLFQKLFDSVGGGQGGFLALTARIGDFLVKLDESLKKGNKLNDFFVKMGAILSVPINMLKRLAHYMGNLFTGFSPGGFSVGIDGMSKAMTPFQKILVKVNALWHRFLDSFGNAGPIFQHAADLFVQFAEGLGPAISTAISHINFEAILQVVRTGLLVGMFLMFRKFLGKGAFSDQLLKVFGKSFGRIGGGLMKNVNNSLKGVTGTMKAMQSNLQAKTLKEIAIAIALLAASVVALSFVDPKRLNPAMTAMTVMLGELLGAMKLIDKFIAAGGARKIPIIAGSLILLAVSIDLLTIAVFALSKLSWKELAKGLGGVAVLLGTLTAVAKPLGAGAPGMIRAGVGIGVIATSLIVMSYAVKQFSKMNLKEMAKGLGGVAASLVVLGVSVTGMPTKGMIIQGAGLLIIAGALLLISQAVKQFGALDLKKMGKGLLGVGASLEAISFGMELMPKNLPITAAGLILVSLALGKIVKAVGSMGKMSLKQIGKGILGLAGALFVLGDAMYAMTGTLGGAAALAVAAAGISILVPSLLKLGNAKGRTVVKSLVALAAAFAVIGLAAELIEPTIPALLGFGAALVLIGAAIALTGAGIALIGVGLSAIAVAGPTAIAILIQSLEDLLKAIPKMATDFALGLLSVVQALADTAPAFVDAIIKIINSLVVGIIKAAPKLAKAFIAILDAVIKILHDRQDVFIQAAFDLVIALLKGIQKNIGAIVTQAGKVIVNFLEGLKSQLGSITKAGADVLVALLTGISKNFWRIAKAGVDAALSFFSALSKSILRLVRRGAQILIDFLNGVAKIIDEREPEIIKAFARIGIAIVKGMVKGVVGSAPLFYDVILDMAKKAWHKMTHFWSFHSPSKLTARLGRGIVQGLAIGINANTPHALTAVNNMNKAMHDSMNKFSFDNLLDTNPTITPILDLSSVQEGVAKIGSMISRNPVGTVSLSQAAIIASSDKAVKQAAEIAPPVSSGNSITFEQNNYSPKELSSVDIYRKTNNQLSKLKALRVPA